METSLKLKAREEHYKTSFRGCKLGASLRVRGCGLLGVRGEVRGRRKWHEEKGGRQQWKIAVLPSVGISCPPLGLPPSDWEGFDCPPWLPSSRRLLGSPIFKVFTGTSILQAENHDFAPMGWGWNKHVRSFWNSPVSARCLQLVRWVSFQVSPASVRIRTFWC